MNDLILLVDDDATGRSVRKLVLETCGHKVAAVGEAQLALRTLQNEPVDLVILDYFLEGTTGTELAKQMRAMKPAVPILLLSGSGDVPEGTENVDGYLSKLEPIAVIEEKITKLLGRSPEPAKARVYGTVKRRGPASQAAPPRPEQEAGST